MTTDPRLVSAGTALKSTRVRAEMSLELSAHQISNVLLSFLEELAMAMIDAEILLNEHSYLNIRYTRIIN